MIFLEEDVLQKLRAGTYETQVNILPWEEVMTPQYPQLIVKESPSSRGIWIDAKPAVVAAKLELIIQAKASGDSENPVTGRRTARGILNEADRILTEQMGFSMEEEAVFSVPEGEPGVCQARAVYIAQIDKRTNEIVRSV